MLTCGKSMSKPWKGHQHTAGPSTQRKPTDTGRTYLTIISLYGRGEEKEGGGGRESSTSYLPTECLLEERGEEEEWMKRRKGRMKRRKEWRESLVDGVCAAEWAINGKFHHGQEVQNHLRTVIIGKTKQHTATAGAKAKC
ncbi:unnamed protein product [Pleuronectes platessa]|uniref:Uncharacterized protein n=1 Tax=Pleuronectes platessa TaxID=8262 RepID=A0A9N7VTG1_PLEPL|nr:unnamed protein product [Pleuronectes platessa]